MQLIQLFFFKQIFNNKIIIYILNYDDISMVMPQKSNDLLATVIIKNMKKKKNTWRCAYFPGTPNFPIFFCKFSEYFIYKMIYIEYLLSKYLVSQYLKILPSSWNTCIYFFGHWTLKIPDLEYFINVLPYGHANSFKNS